MICIAHNLLKLHAAAAWGRPTHASNAHTASTQYPGTAIPGQIPSLLGHTRAEDIVTYRGIATKVRRDQSSLLEDRIDGTRLQRRG